MEMLKDQACSVNARVWLRNWEHHYPKLRAHRCPVSYPTEKKAELGKSKDYAGEQALWQEYSI